MGLNSKFAWQTLKTYRGHPKLYFPICLHSECWGCMGRDVDGSLTIVYLDIFWLVLMGQQHPPCTTPPPLEVQTYGKIWIQMFSKDFFMFAMTILGLGPYWGHLKLCHIFLRKKCFLFIPIPRNALPPLRVQTYGKI